MGSMQRYGLKNNLIRWVHRHDRMATLFRSSMPGPQLSVSPRRLPSYRSTVQSESQGNLSEGATFESQSASPMIDKPVKATPGQMDYSAEPTVSKNAVLSSKSASSK